MRSKRDTELFQTKLEPLDEASREWSAQHARSAQELAAKMEFASDGDREDDDRVRTASDAELTDTMAPPRKRGRPYGSKTKETQITNFKLYQPIATEKSVEDRLAAAISKRAPNKQRLTNEQRPGFPAHLSEKKCRSLVANIKSQGNLFVVDEVKAVANAINWPPRTKHGWPHKVDLHNACPTHFNRRSIVRDNSFLKNTHPEQFGIPSIFLAPYHENTQHQHQNFRDDPDNYKVDGSFRTRKSSIINQARDGQTGRMKDSAPVAIRQQAVPFAQEEITFNSLAIAQWLLTQLEGKDLTAASLGQAARKSAGSRLGKVERKAFEFLIQQLHLVNTTKERERSAGKITTARLRRARREVKELQMALDTLKFRSAYAFDMRILPTVTNFLLLQHQTQEQARWWMETAGESLVERESN